MQQSVHVGDGVADIPLDEAVGSGGPAEPLGRRGPGRRLVADPHPCPVPEAERGGRAPGDEGNLSEAKTAVQLPAILHALALGQWSQVIARLGLTTADLTPAGPTSLQDATIKCSDAWAAMYPATVGQQGPSLFAPIITAQAQWMHALCSAWPHDPGVSGTVRSTVPVVFLNGTADNTDPPANVACATATMPNALLVSVPGTGHRTLDNATDPGCLLAATTAFIQAWRSPPAQRPGTPAPAPWPRNSYHSRHPETASYCRCPLAN